MTLVRFLTFTVGVTLHILTFTLVGAIFVAGCALFIGMPIYVLLYLLMVSLFGR